MHPGIGRIRQESAVSSMDNNHEEESGFKGFHGFLVYARGATLKVYPDEKSDQHDGSK